jgi:uncharacterized protein
MAKDDKPKDLMGYEAMQQDALRAVIRAALAKAASPRGLPGDHHFYISFRTAAPGVEGPDDLLSRYPGEMTIVLQNQFWDLAPRDSAFSVTLQFGGQPKSLTVPYAAVTRFYDPSVQYLLQFNPAESAPAAATAAKAGGPKPAAGPQAKRDGTPGPDGEPKIVSLDQFRKK